MKNKWIQEKYVTEFDDRISYDYDTISAFHTLRMYEWVGNKNWKNCQRHYIVADTDLIYSKQGKKTTFDKSLPHENYYIIDPTKIECKNKIFVLNYFMVRSIGDIKKEILIKNLRFVGIPLIFLTEEKKVDYNFVFDVLEETIDERELYSKDSHLSIFPISQSRAVFASLYKNINLPKNIPKTGTVESFFDYYNILHQFSEKYEEVSSNSDNYSKSNYKKVHKLNKKTTKEEWEAIKDKEKEKVKKDMQNKIKKITDKLDVLENSSNVKKYVELYEKLAILHEKKKVEKTEALKKDLESKMSILYKDEKVAKWAKLTEKIQDIAENTIEMSVSVEYMKEIVEKEANEMLNLILTEFLPENDIEDDEDDIEESNDEGFNDESLGSEIESLEESESLDLSDDSQEENIDGEEIVEWSDNDSFTESEESSENEVDSEEEKENIYEKKIKSVNRSEDYNEEDYNEDEDEDFNEDFNDEESDESESSDE